MSLELSHPHATRVGSAGALRPRSGAPSGFGVAPLPQMEGRTGDDGLTITMTIPEIVVSVTVSKDWVRKIVASDDAFARLEDKLRHAARPWWKRWL